MDSLESVEILFDKIKEKIRRDTMDEVNANSIDARVRAQHSRIYKFYCWLRWNHLEEKGVCLRCGKKFIPIKTR